jgi:hypothetical protein
LSQLLKYLIIYESWRKQAPKRLAFFVCGMFVIQALKARYSG